HRFTQNPASAGFLLSESVTQMNDCPRRYTQRKRLIGQFHRFTQNSASAGFLLSESVTRMNDCPRRYTQKKAAYRSVSPLYVKTPLRRGFCYLNP
ncbi:hypothetical protein, partial [Klebsiella quasipneumoniae]|uniref:hypothetical protein n=3 Tax=Klebsiella quasipneumoniae TaxID=1463165 RepID=UPI0023B080AE